MLNVEECYQRLRLRGLSHHASCGLVLPQAIGRSSLADVLVWVSANPCLSSAVVTQTVLWSRDVCSSPPVVSLIF